MAPTLHARSDTPRGAVSMPAQRSFEDLGTPLHQVTFCVVDLETTGGSPAKDAITEVGAVLLRGGECLATFQTLVNPGRSIPPSITVLTGITEAMVIPAPRIEAVLPSLVEFIGGAVVVGHNVRFDIGFLDAALCAAGRDRLANPRVDTCALARRLVRDEVRNCKLSTLADHFGVSTRPTHRALDDALATGELLHCLLERVGTIGVTGLEDLLALPKLAAHPQRDKLRLTTALPRAPGVYLFRDRSGRPIYVGTATDLRSRVRSYFGSDDRRKVGQLLREVHTIDHHECATSLEAAITEVRWIHALQPRFNRRGRDPRRFRYLRLTTGEPFPRLAVVRSAVPGSGAHLGPFPSTRAARQALDAIHGVSPLRRCTQRLRDEPLCTSPCTPAQIGVSLCPCADPDGARAAHDSAAAQVHAGFTSDPALLVEPLRAQLRELARHERFEEAAELRDRAEALVQAMRRRRRIATLRASGELIVEVPGRGGVAFQDGVAAACWGVDGQLRHLAEPPDDQTASAADEPIDELLTVMSWLDRNSERIRLEHCSGTFSTELPKLASFQPTKDTADRRPVR